MRRSIAPWAALAGSLFLTLAGAAFVFNTARHRDRVRFAGAVRNVQERLAARFEMHEGLLRGVAGLLAAHPGATAADFHAWVQQLDLPEHSPGQQGIGYARRIRRAESGQFEGELQARGFAGLRIWPDLGREERTAIAWLEPLDSRNRRAIGYDMLTEPVRREAMERARDDARPALSGKVTLVQELDDQRQAGFLLYQPVYRGGSAPQTVQARREALIGWSYSPFRAGDFLAGVFGRDPEPLVDFRLYDGPGEDAARLIRDAPRAVLSNRSQRETVQMRLGGREWTLSFVSLPALETDLWPALVALLAGVCISAAVFALSVREVRARERAETAVAELRRSLEERGRFEEQLREEGRVNSILRRLGIALAAELDADRLAQLVADEAASVTGAELGGMFDNRRRKLALSGSLRDQAGDFSLRPGSAVLERAFSGERAVRIDDLGDQGPVFDGAVAPVRSLLAAPVVLRNGELRAGLVFGHSRAGHFTAHHERLLLGLSAQAAIALDNARLLRDLQETDRRKDEFLAVLGHELRNPLAPVVTALEVAKREPESAPRQLAVIERQARHMVRIVDDLLDVSRISRGKIELRLQPVPVREALDRAVETVAPLALSREQKLTVIPPAEPLLVEADPVRLEQILGNLLANAVKYTPPGGAVELSAELRGGALELRVRDTGIGIAQEAQDSLFDPFVQVADAKDYATGGLGIGLALVRGLVELHGGRVSVYSDGAGTGSVFTVRLPGVSRGTTPLEVRPVPARAHRGRVLVVDDNVDAALTLSEAMRLDGHEVRVAHDGHAAVAEAALFAPEVVLLDIGLPGLDGYQVVRELRRLPQVSHALIVALTGFGQESDRVRALEAGFDEHLVKPVDLDTVHAVLARRLGKG